MNKNDRTTRAFDNEVQIGVINPDENGFGERVIVRHSRRDVLLFKSAGDAHDCAIGGTATLDGNVRDLVTDILDWVCRAQPAIRRRL